MIILGIGGASDMAATLLVDGHVVAAAREERFNRVKHSGDFPRAAIEYCLRAGGVSLEEVDRIGFAWNPAVHLEPFEGVQLRRHKKEYLWSIPNNVLNLIRGGKELRRVEQTDLVLRLPSRRSPVQITFPKHHLAHAASTFFVSPFDEAAILTMDAQGEEVSILLAQGVGNHIEVLETIEYPHALGAMYAAFTQFLGFEPNDGEGKVMGLSAFGQPTFLDDLREVVRLREDGRIELDLSYFSYYLWRSRRFSDKFVARFGKERLDSEAIESRHHDLAASFQAILEEAALHLVRHLHRLTGSRNLCIAGGVGMNSVMNGRLKREGPFQAIYVQPAADDAGTALGVALWIHHVLDGQLRAAVMTHDYLGPEFSEREIQAALDLAKVPYERPADIATRCAELLARGSLLGWFQGRMEFGQRALGNRSILADPRSGDVKDRLNRLVKHRELFRPFAPSILEERTAEYFDSGDPSPFMQMVYCVQPEKRDVVPGITHIDGTGRIHTVSRQANPLYWRLIDAFDGLTGVPIVLNTSFNIKGEPIVCTPADALRCYFSTGLDHLAMGPFLLRKGA